MAIDWLAVNQALSPIKGYEDLRRRFQTSFRYPFVGEIFNFALPELAAYTTRLLGGDPRGRYSGYLSSLLSSLDRLQQAEVADIQDLVARVETPERFERFSEQSGISVTDLVAVLKYLIYWVIPGEKYLSGLVREDPLFSQAIQALRAAGIRTNLELLQAGRTPAGRQTLAEASGLPAAVILDLVHRADFSRLPWASKATISNIIGSGCASLAQLASADPEQLYAAFFRYGQSIGKNLKLGNEIDNSYRIAQIVPVVVQGGSGDG